MRIVRSVLYVALVFALVAGVVWHTRPRRVVGHYNPWPRPMHPLLACGLKPAQIKRVTVEIGQRLYIMKDAAMIGRIYGALGHFDGPASDMARDGALGFMVAGGKTLVVGFTLAGEVGDYTSDELESLLEALQSDGAFESTSRVPPFEVRSAVILRDGRRVAVPRSTLPMLQHEANRLVHLWCPDSLEGCDETETKFVTPSEIESRIRMYLRSPVALRIFVGKADPYVEWPPMRPAWMGLYKQISCSRLEIIKCKDDIELRFYAPGERKWYTTSVFSAYNVNPECDLYTYMELYRRMMETASR